MNINFNANEETLDSALGITRERADEITSHEFCGLPEGHNNFEHIKAVLEKDLTLEERLLFMFEMGVQAAYNDIRSQVMSQFSGVTFPSSQVH